jgi:ketosteroid isomerase-like protein
MSDADYQTEQEIRRLAHEWLDAARARDRATLERILAEDFVISGWQPEGRLADKEYYVEDCLRPVEISEGTVIRQSSTASWTFTRSFRGESGEERCLSRTCGFERATSGRW